MDSERFKRGAEKLNQLEEGIDKEFMNDMGKIAPDLARYVIEFNFGDLYNRPGLDMKTKQMLTITIVATLGIAPNYLAFHINGGLNLGMTRQEIIDIMTHVAGYAGFPAALNGVNTAKQVFDERDKKNIKDK